MHITPAMVSFSDAIQKDTKSDASVCVYCTHFGQEESLREEHDLTDLLEVGDNDHHRSEQSLHTLWELRAAGVAWVHGDEYANPVI